MRPTLALMARVTSNTSNIHSVFASGGKRSRAPEEHDAGQNAKVAYGTRSILVRSCSADGESYLVRGPIICVWYVGYA